MIGLFDTGHGGLTIYQALAKHMPQRSFVYFGDHGNAPYGSRPAHEILDYTRAAIEVLFERGCPLVVLACNTATAVALRTLQQQWLPYSRYKDNRVLGIIVPTVEVVAQRVQRQDALVAVFGTQRTIESNVFEIEIHKRNPALQVVQQICPKLAGAIELGASEAELEQQVQLAVEQCLQQARDSALGRAPDSAILGCTHFPIVGHLFKKYLPVTTHMFSQGDAVAERLTDYIIRHPEFEQRTQKQNDIFLTSGDSTRVTADAQRLLGVNLPFENVTKNIILR
jgi:glutamate racemase